MADGVGEEPYNAERGGASRSSLLAGGLQRNLQRRPRTRDGGPSSRRTQNNNRGEPAITEEARKPHEDKTDNRGNGHVMEELLMFIAPSAAQGAGSSENKGYCRGLHGELVKEEKFAATTAATCHMLIAADRFENYRVCDGGQVRIANGNLIPIAGYGDVTIAFRSEGGWTPVRLKGVAHVQRVIFNVVSLTKLISEGHAYLGDQHGTTLRMQGGVSVLFPYYGSLTVQSGYRPGPDGSADVPAPLAP